MSSIFVGCPIFERDWILDRWFTAVAAQGIHPKELSIVFGLTNGEDDTIGIINKYTKFFKETFIINCDDIESFRTRATARYNSLAVIRNRILDFLTTTDAEYFFSWDSDILLPVNSLVKLIEDDKDMVGPWVSLVGNDNPNCATIMGNNVIQRLKPITHHYPKGELFQVGTVFACALMKRKVFTTCRYGWHNGGEDYYFGLEMQEHGFESWVDGRIIGIHHYNKKESYGR